MTYTWDDSKTTYTGTYRGGLAAPALSPFRRLLNEAERNGWEHVAYDGATKLVHEDGTTLLLYFVRGPLCSGRIRTPYASSIVSAKEAKRIIGGLRCQCTQALSDCNLPDPHPNCELEHQESHLVIELREAASV